MRLNAFNFIPPKKLGELAAQCFVTLKEGKMEMPKTKKQLLVYLNALLTDLVQEAQGDCDRSSCITFYIDGNHTVIQECIENRLEEYNAWHEKFNWQYSVQNDGSNDYTLYVSQITIEQEPTFDSIDDDETSLAE